MRKRSWLFIIAFSTLVIAGAKAAESISSNASTSKLPPASALANPEPEGLTGVSFDTAEVQGFTEVLLGHDREAPGIANGDAFLEAVTRPPEPHSEARVPEPTTLLLIGTGLIGLRRVSRSKWRRRSGLGNLIGEYAA